MEGPLLGMLADVFVLSAAGRIIFEQVSPSVSSVSEDEQQEALEDFRNEQVGLIWGCAVHSSMEALQCPSQPHLA
jgi:hypothetical protein